MIILTFSILISTTSLALLRQTPLQIGLALLTMALLVSISFSISISTWVAFLIFLIYIGGILVIFTYFIATIPNNKIPITIILIIFLYITIIFFSIIYSINININPPTLKYTESTTFYNTRQLPTLILIAIRLLIALLVVVKVSNTKQGPLRPFNNYV